MLKRVLVFLNLLDEAGNLSITNVAVIVGITKMALASSFSGVDATALIGTLLNYAHKRFTNSQDTNA